MVLEPWSADVDPGPQDPCVVAATDKYTGTTEILWRKRDSRATLSRGEHPDPCLDRLLLLFWAHYIEDDPHLLCTGCFRQLQKAKERGLLIT